jgi:hypothetical protein
MRMCRSGDLITVLFVLGAAMAVSACTTTETGVSQASANTAASAPAAPPPAAASQPAAGPMTREKASTDCWMKYEKEARALSLDQRLPLVEKCTAEKLKTAG